MTKNVNSPFMQMALSLAKKGLGKTYPNPMVAAVIVKNGKIIAQGYHKKAGQNHAEIEALKNASEDVKGSTLYVNLEPCSHFGKTPPCIESLIKSGISEVICSTLDPNPIVNGAGIKLLQKAGIKTEIGLLEPEARQLNEAFFTFHEKKRPFITLKFAASLDGKIATFTGDSKWITNEKARKYARHLRSQYQSVLVGISTVLKDNPELRGNNNPLRIILDSTLKIPLDSNVLNTSNTLIVTTKHFNKEKKQKLVDKGIEILIIDEKKIQIKKLLRKLYNRNIISLFVEGGGNVLGSFIDSGLIDKVYAFHAPIIIGGAKAISAVEGKGAEKVSRAINLRNVSFKKFGDNLLTAGYTK